jgi:hypothetical protein
MVIWAMAWAGKAQVLKRMGLILPERDDPAAINRIRALVKKHPAQFGVLPLESEKDALTLAAAWMENQLEK